MKRRRIVLVPIAMVVLSTTAIGGTSASTPMDQDGACTLLKKRVATLDSLPEPGPVGMGWFCDFGGFKDKRDDRWFLVALRSNRDCDGACSNLIGWYAVDRATGTIHNFDMEEFEVGAELEP